MLFKHEISTLEAKIVVTDLTKSKNTLHNKNIILELEFCSKETNKKKQTRILINLSVFECFLLFSGKIITYYIYD